MTDPCPPEGREELKRQLDLLKGCCPWTEEGYNGECSFVMGLSEAIDGLDIAEERDRALVEWAAELWPHHKMEEGHRNDLCMCCRFWEIARPWQGWKQGMTPAEEEL